MSEKPNFLEDIQKGKPESFKEEVFTARKRNFTPFYVGVGAILIVAFLLYILVNRGVEVPDMSGWKEGEVYNWGKENGVTIVKEGVYDLVQDTGILIEQGTAAGDKLKKSNPLNVKISLGPDPNEALPLIDLKASSEEEIKAWVAENKLTGISIRYEASQVIPQGTVINFEIVDGTASSFLRKNRVNVFVSSGPEVVSDTVSVPDFYKATKGTVVQWATKNGIEVVYTEAFDEFIELGAIRSQSIQADTKITRSDILEVELSLGVAIVVPDFSGMTKTAAADLATRNSITLYYEQAESVGEPDEVLSQDIIAGSSIAKNQPITLTISKESEYKEVPNFVGLSQSEATSLAALHNIKLFFVTVDSTQNSEKVISQDLQKGDFVSSASYVTLKISSGKLIVPNFIGLTKTEAETMAEAGGFTLTFDTDAAVDGSQYTILTQSRPADSLIDKTTGIRLTTGVKIPNLMSLKKSEVDLWATKNKIAVQYFETYHDSKAFGTLYDQSVVDQILPTGDTVILFYSLGKIPVTDFVGKNKLDVVTWINEVNAKGGELTAKYTEVESASSDSGTIVNQSVRTDLVKVKSTITFYVAKEKDITVPDFSTKTLSEARTWASSNGVTLTEVERYSETIAAGKIYEQSVKGKLIVPKDGVSITVSIGKLSIPSFYGQSKSDVEAFIKTANEKGASLKATYVYISSSSLSKDQVSSQSSTNTNVALDATVTIYLVGTVVPETPDVGSVTIPSLVGFTEDAFDDWATANYGSASSVISVVEKYSDTYSEGRIIYQSTTGTISKDTAWTVHKSLGKVKIPDQLVYDNDLIGWKNMVAFQGGSVIISYINNVPGGTIKGIYETSDVAGAKYNVGDEINYGTTIYVDIN